MAKQVLNQHKHHKEKIMTPEKRETTTGYFSFTSPSLHLNSQMIANDNEASTKWPRRV
jgi:hypothetical protein